MTASGWAIRFYLPDEPNETIDWVSSFEGWNRRSHDEVVAFSGMYDTEDYMLWYAAKDLPNLDVSDVCIDLMLFMEGDPKLPFFNEKYRVHSVMFDPTTDRYVVYAIHEDHVSLMIELWDHKITGFTAKEPQDGAEVLATVLTGILGFYYHKDESRGFLYKYKNVPFDKFWKLKDVINYITTPNRWEWTLKYGDLHFGPEIPPIKDYRSFRLGDQMADNIPESAFFMKVMLESTPINVLSHWKEEYRCIWVKHSVGKSGGVTKACFARIGKTVNKEMYVRTLEKGIEKDQGYAGLLQDKKYASVLLGRILQDNTGSFEPYADFATISKDIKNENVKIPRNIIFYDKDGNTQMFDQIGRTTPYLDNGAGILFPVVSENAPNSILLLPNGDIESAVLGPFVFGNGDKGFVIPVKNINDFRLQFPNGWVLYVHESGETILRYKGAPANIIPSGKGDTIIHISADGTISFAGGSTALAHANHIHGMNFHTHISNGPGVATGPAVPSDTETCNDNTQKTLAD